MASLLSAADFQAALVREGCRLLGLPGWDGHNRDAGHTPLTPNGVVIHHTGSDTSDPVGYSKNILWNGYAGLPGPLCHVGGAPDGTLILVGHGRANHAGGGDQAVLNAVIADQAPMSGELHPNFGNLNGVDGNSHFYGLEIMYSGGHPMTAAQRIAAVKFATAICRAHGWTAGSVIGHREWSKDKPDPGMCPMDLFRQDVAAALAVPAGVWPNTALPTGGGAGTGVHPPAPPAPPKPPAQAPKPAVRVPPTQAYQGNVYLGPLKPGSTNSDSVRVLQRALRNYAGISTIPLNPSGVTGNYGAETAAMVNLVYRTFDAWQPGQGWGSGDLNTPGRALLDKLGCRIVG